MRIGVALCLSPVLGNFTFSCSGEDGVHRTHFRQVVLQLCSDCGSVISLSHQSHNVLVDRVVLKIVLNQEVLSGLYIIDGVVRGDFRGRQFISNTPQVCATVQLA